MAFIKPSDVPDYVERPAIYSQDGHSVRGNGVDLDGGTPPFFAVERADPNPTDLATTPWLHGGVNLKTPTSTPPAGEAKFRTHIGPSHVLRDDPIRNFGQPGAAHWHLFFGNYTANAYSTYRSLRMNPESTNAGGPLNGTAYWIPAFLVTLNGKQYAKVADFSSVYYVTSPIAAAGQAIRMPRGMRYVTGWNMEDHHLTKYAAEQAGRYFDAPWDGFAGWKMVGAFDSPVYGNTLPVVNGPQAGAGSYLTRQIVNSDGSDPWGGAATSDYQLIGVLNAPDWWDGQNPWSPGGYDHFRFSTRRQDNAFGGIGPLGWWKVPQLEITFFYSHGGWEDYKTWVLSSDNHLAHHSPDHAAMPPGSTFHADWFGAWDHGAMMQWQRHGLGCEGFTANELNDSTISPTQSMSVGIAPNGRRAGRTQIPVNTRRYTTPESMVLLPSTGAGKGPFTTGGRAVAA